MKIILVLLLVLVVFLTACSTGNTYETSNMIESEASNNATNANSISISDEEVYEIFSTLNERALSVIFWYLAETSDDLGIATESTYAPYYKISKFSTIDEMKAATDEAFTTGFAKEALI